MLILVPPQKLMDASHILSPGKNTSILLIEESHPDFNHQFFGRGFGTISLFFHGASILVRFLTGAWLVNQPGCLSSIPTQPKISSSSEDMPCQSYSPSIASCKHLAGRPKGDVTKSKDRSRRTTRKGGGKVFFLFQMEIYIIFGTLSSYGFV